MNELKKTHQLMVCCSMIFIGGCVFLVRISDKSLWRLEGEIGLVLFSIIISAVAVVIGAAWAFYCRAIAHENLSFWAWGKRFFPYMAIVGFLLWFVEWITAPLTSKGRGFIWPLIFLMVAGFGLMLYLYNSNDSEKKNRL